MGSLWNWVKNPRGPPRFGIKGAHPGAGVAAWPRGRAPGTPRGLGKGSRGREVPTPQVGQGGAGKPGRGSRGPGFRRGGLPGPGPGQGGGAPGPPRLGGPRGAPAEVGGGRGPASPGQGPLGGRGGGSFSGGAGFFQSEQPRPRGSEIFPPRFFFPPPKKIWNFRPPPCKGG